MKHIICSLITFSFIGIASTVLATSITSPVYDSAGDDLWAYYYSEEGISNSSLYHESYSASFVQNAKNNLLGYVSGDYGDWSESFMGVEGESTTTRVFETYIVSNIDQSVKVTSGGDDGNSIFIDEVFAAGGGYSTSIFTYLNMTAGVSYKISLVNNNASGPWHTNYGFQLMDDSGTYSTVLFSEATSLSMNAVDDFSAPVPEPATMLFFGAGLSGLAARRFRKKK